MTLHESIKNQTAFAKQHVEPKLITRMRMFIIIFIGLLGFIIYDIASNAFNPFILIGAFIGGIIVGYAAGRMFAIRWHEETSKVVARLDRIGIIILVLYIGFSIARGLLFGLWLHGPLLTAFSLTFGTGAILGRILMMTKNIRKVLSKQGISLSKEV